MRIAAGHLRRALERYYLTAGRSDNVVIIIPKGCYIPTFIFSESQTPSPTPTLAQVGLTRSPAPTLAQAPVFWRGIIIELGGATIIVFAVIAILMSATAKPRPPFPETPQVEVTMLEDLTRSGASTVIASGLTQEIVVQLSKLDHFTVVQAAIGGARLDPPPRFVLAGSVEISGEIFHLRVRLGNREDGSILWANTFSGRLEPSELVNKQSDTAEDVAKSLALTIQSEIQAFVFRMTSHSSDHWNP